MEGLTIQNHWHWSSSFEVRRPGWKNYGVIQCVMCVLVRLAILSLTQQGILGIPDSLGVPESVTGFTIWNSL